MRQLHVLGVTDEGDALLLGTDGGKVSHRLPLDEKLRAVVRGQLSAVVSDRAEIALSPKEIQSRMRAGETPEEVAKAARVPVARVLPYAAPVIAERQRIVDDARAAVVRRHRGPAAERPLGEVVDAHLADAAGLRPESVEWTARRRRDGAWIVSLAYSARGGRRSASWLWKPLERELTTIDNLGSRLSAEERPAGAKRAAARPKPASKAAKSSRSRPKAKRAAAARKATAKKAARSPGTRKAASARPATKRTAAKAATKRAVAKRTVAKRTVAKPAAKRSVAKPAAKRIVAKRAAAKPVTKRAVAKRVTKRAVAKPAPTKAVTKRTVSKPVTKRTVAKPAVKRTAAKPAGAKRVTAKRPAVAKSPAARRPDRAARNDTEQTTIAPVVRIVPDPLPPDLQPMPDPAVAPQPAAAARKPGARVPVPSWSDVLLGVAPARERAADEPARAPRRRKG